MVDEHLRMDTDVKADDDLAREDIDDAVHYRLLMT